MVEAVCDLWDEPSDAVCITTNSTVTPRGLVMGGGVALQARVRYPSLPKVWGYLVEHKGNHVYATVTDDARTVFSFPTKNEVRLPSHIYLIEQSCHELMRWLDEDKSLKKVLLPRPGCGLGGLSWDAVKPIIEPILDDRVWVITNE